MDSEVCLNREQGCRKGRQRVADRYGRIELYSRQSGTRMTERPETLTTIGAFVIVEL
jgi:hypothetical protein